MDHKVFLTQDVSKEAASCWKAFMDLCPAFRTRNARYGHIHPCFFKVTYTDETVTYDDPVKLKKLISDQS